jgi:membrane protein DedA with SNARE-associated domain
MPLGRFVLFTAAGCIPWVLMLAIIGREVGARWEDWRGYLHYLDYLVIAAVILGVVYLIVRRRRAAAQAEPTPPA